MPETLSTGTLAVDIQPFLDQLGLAQQATAKLTQGVVDSSARITKSYADLTQQQADASTRALAAAQEQRLQAAATVSAAEAVRGLTTRQRELAVQQKGIGSATSEYQRLTKELDKNAQSTAKITTQLKAEAEASKQVTVAVKEQAAASSQASESAGKSTGFFSGLLSKASVAFAGLFAVDKIKEVAGEIEDVTAKFEKYRIVLAGAFGGDQNRAGRALVQVSEFVKQNGGDVDLVTESYVKLVNRGIIPTTTQLRQLADISATSSKSTDQYVEALLDAQTGEFERLKEFGIKVKSNGDTLVFTYNNVKTTIKNTSDAITQYLFALGDSAGVQGQAAAQLKSLSGSAVESKNALTELYEVLGDRAKGAFSGFNNIVGRAARGLADFFKTTDRAAFEQSAAGIDKYQQYIGAALSQVAAQAKASGQDIDKAVEQAAADQEQFIQRRIKKAQQALDAYNQRIIRDSVGSDVDIRDPVEETKLKAAVDLAKGQLDVLQKASKSVADSAKEEADQVGRIAALRLKIAANEKLRDAAPDTKAGNAERERLVALLKQENDELQKLLGKEEKVKKARQYSYESQLQALLSERRMLTDLAAKAGEQIAVSETDRARLVFQQALTQVDAIEKKLEARERDLRAAAQKAGGAKAVQSLGSLADGQVDGAEENRLNILKVAAVEKYYKDLYAIESAREARLFDLRESSDAKEFDAVERHYADLRRAATDDAERQLVERARVLAQIALLQQQQQRRIDNTATIGSANAVVAGATYGVGTGISQTAAKRAEKDELLKIEKEAAEKTLANAQLLSGEEGRVAQARAAAQLAQIKESIRAVEEEKAKHKATDFLYGLVLGENDNAENRALLDQTVSASIQAVNDVLNAQQQAAQQEISTRQQNITDLQSQLAAEIELHKTGAASNIQTIQQQIKDEKAAKREALEQSREIAKQQQIVNDLQAVSSISLAVANIIAGWSNVPIIGSVLGIIAAGAMVASFISTKASASQAAQGQYFVGGFTPEGGKYEEAGTVHKGEFVANQQVTSDYRSLLKALHEGQPDAIDWSSPKLAALLPDYALPGQLREEREQARQLQVNHAFAPMAEKFDALDSRLAAIEGSNREMADQWTILKTEGGFIRVDPKTNSSHEISIR
ncbi:MAG: hypothetical protein ACRYFZ_09525 [Janthinobacterium lividum]